LTEPGPEATLQAGRYIAFSTLGVLSTTQELAARVLDGMEGADPELVAEETLSLVATATARATEVALRNAPEVARTVSTALLELPFTYREYLVGSAMIAQRDPTLHDTNAVVFGRLQRKAEFYRVHLPVDQFPGERLLTDKMGLWMGRVSPPRLPESPTDRLARLDLVATLLVHLKLILAFGKKER
jgi:hypothetical protein